VVHPEGAGARAGGAPDGGRLVGAAPGDVRHHR
jgi:hypothetical protein